MRFRTVLPVLMTGIAVASPGFADSVQDEAIVKGQAHFSIFCASCHGENADGHGVLATSLEITPSDLTALRQTSGDFCIAERVLKAVAGLHDVAPGQEQKMPTFSDSLEGITIYQITQYLKSIQK